MFGSHSFCDQHGVGRGGGGGFLDDDGGDDNFLDDDIDCPTHREFGARSDNEDGRMTFGSGRRPAFAAHREHGTNVRQSVNAAQGAGNVAADDELEKLHAKLDGRRGGEPQANGFVDKNGNRRKYNAPPPPEDVDWIQLGDRLLEWSQAGDARPRAQDVDGREPFQLYAGGAPGPTSDDDFSESSTRKIVREAEEILRPLAISADAEGRPRLWTDAAERELCERGVRLADSLVLRVEETRCCFGVRIFHLTFRFFVAVIVAGIFAVDEKTEFSLANKRFVGYYYLAMTVDQAIIERCM